MLLLVLALATQEPVVVDPAIDAARAAARAAVDAGRFCDASFYDEALAALTGKTSGLYNAAEDAYAAGDVVRALRLYKLVAERDVEKKLKPQQVAARITELEKKAKTSTATTCAAPAAVCGNGVVEAGEVCDDVDHDEGDGCLSTCQAPATTTTTTTMTTTTTTAAEAAPVPVNLILYAGGGLVGAVGVAVIVGGALPFFAFQSADAELVKREAALDDPGELPAQQAQAKADFESWGQVAVFGGAALVVVGAGLVVAGALSE